MSKITDSDIDRIADRVIEKLKETNRNSNKYIETESILYGYTGYKTAIERNMKTIEDILRNGVSESQKTGNVERVKGGPTEYKGTPEKEIEKIEHLKSENLKFEKRIIRVDNALIHIENDKYFEIIKLKYFKNWTIEEIAEKLNVNEKTIGRNRTRLVEKLQFYLFPEHLLD